MIRKIKGYSPFTNLSYVLIKAEGNVEKSKFCLKSAPQFLYVKNLVPPRTQKRFDSSVFARVDLCTRWPLDDLTPSSCSPNQQNVYIYIYVFMLYIIDDEFIFNSVMKQTKQERPQQSNKSELIWIPTLLAVLVLCTICFLSIVIYRRKSKFIYELLLQPDYFTV